MTPHQTLAAPAAAGAQTFDDLLGQHRGIVFKVAASYARDPEDRRDLAQEILTQVWRAYPRYDPSRRFTTWMYRIALNVAISHRRAVQVRDRHVSTLPDGDLLNLPGAATSESDGRLRDLRQVIARLDDLHRALVVLYLDGYSYAEIADVLGITETNVATKLNRLKERLRQELADPQGRKERNGTR
jgi:RNA polymerase sigma-70 factor (ECF subfamily)